MRMISSNELPDDFEKLTIIKSGERNRYRRFSIALERTLTRCSEIRAEYEAHTVALREACQKEGFTAGFELIFPHFIQMLEEYEKLQNKRLDALRKNLIDALESSLHDPVIVNRIIHHLQEKCGHQKAIRIIIPKKVSLPADIDISNYQFSDDNHITVQNDIDSIRFPGELLCKQWLAYAENETSSLGMDIASLIPEMLHNIGMELLSLAEAKRWDIPVTPMKDNI